MKKIVKVVICGAVDTERRLNASFLDMVAQFVTPYDKNNNRNMRSAILNECRNRFYWFQYMPMSYMKMHWIDDEGDRISIYTEYDMDICVERCVEGGAIPKIYIVISPPKQ